MPDRYELSRRALLRAGGAAAGAGLLGAGAAGTATAAEDVGVEFTNLRVREAQHAWDRGYRGQADRSLALTDTGADARHPDIGDWTGVLVEDGDADGYGLAEIIVWQFDSDGETEKTEGGDPFEGIDPDDIHENTPKMVGWFPHERTYTDSDVPRDGNSHGTHVSGIMAGSGEASAIDQSNSRVDEPRAVLLPGDSLSYEVDAQAGTGVFGSAYGEGIEITIEGPDGRQLRRSRGASGTSEVSFINNTAETPTVHDEGEATYTVHVRPTEGEALPARVNRVAVGPFLPHEETVGERTADGDLALHTGIAPNASLLPLEGIVETTPTFADNAEWFADTFNTRVVNMSWGSYVPFEKTAEEQLSTIPRDVRKITDAGILVVASAGNNGTPATGPTGPAGTEEAIATVACGALDGLAAYTSGGTPARDEDGELYNTPDVTTMGGTVNHLEMSSMPGEVEDDPEHEGYGEVREYNGKGGTSMASPQAAGTAGLVAQALEEDAPDSIALPEPAETTREDVFRLKQVLLGTASTTAFTAAPYHRGHQKPVYTFDTRDSYEGFGRVNVGAAVDAVSRELTDETVAGTVGFDVPDDQRAEAGYVRVERPGEIQVDLEFSHLSGGNRGMAKGDPHLDLFVYDAQQPADGGEPNVVASAQALQGDASVSVTVTDEEFVDRDERVFAVVAKLVNVPGLVNGYDAQVHFDLGTTFDPAGPGVVGDAEMDSDVYAGDQTARVTVSAETVAPADQEVLVRDFVPEPWAVDEAFSPDDFERYPALNGTYVVFGVDDPRDAYEDRQYAARSPDDTTRESGSYEFGPLAVTTETSDPSDPDNPRFDERDWIEIDGTARDVTVVAQDV